MTNTPRGEAMRRFREALQQRGFRMTNSYHRDEGSRASDVLIYTGPHALSPLFVQAFYGGNPRELEGFDAYAPLTSENSVDALIRALDTQPQKPPAGTDLIAMPFETVERVTDALNALLTGKGRNQAEIIEQGRAALRELATMTSAGANTIEPDAQRQIGAIADAADEALHPKGGAL